jgi:hypothetical protein
VLLVEDAGFRQEKLNTEELDWAKMELYFGGRRYGAACVPLYRCCHLLLTFADNVPLALRGWCVTSVCSQPGRPGTN